MYRACIAVVATSRARLFKYERWVEAEATTEHWSTEPDVADEPGVSQTVARQLAKLLRTAQTQRVILCATPSMLGELRQACRSLPGEGVAVYEHENDLVTLTPAQLREYLDTQDLLPAPP